MWTLSKPIGTTLVLLSIFLFSRPAQAKYGGGSGTADDPYLIATAADLIALGDDPNDYNKHFILTDDIDLAGHVFDKAVIAADANDAESGFQGVPFTGVFDGNGHTVSHLRINGAGYLGVFGQLEEGAQVKNVGLVDVNIVGSGPYSVGGLVGSNGDSLQRIVGGGVIVHCYSTGSVNGRVSVGGLVGLNEGSVIQCYSTAAVSGTQSVGGLVGGNYDEASVAQCYSTGAVNGTESAGGLVGRNSYSSVVQCYSTAAVSGDSTVGGLVGDNHYGGVGQCYSTGPVSGTHSVGGLVGYNYYGGATASFWDTQTSGQAKSAGGTGKTTAEMQTAATFLLWATCGNEGIWTINEGEDYPRLWWENRPGELIGSEKLSDLLLGTGTENDPFLIYTADELNMVGLYPCEWDKYFKLMADIDLSGFDGKDGRPAFNVIGRENIWFRWFTGIFDGNGHTVSHLTINGAGLFGQLASGAEVRDLGVVDVNITGSGGCVGGLVGYNFSGNVTRCYSTGVVRGSGTYVGGLVGLNRGSVTQCYSTASVSRGGCISADWWERMRVL